MPRTNYRQLMAHKSKRRVSGKGKVWESGKRERKVTNRTTVLSDPRARTERAELTNDVTPKDGELFSGIVNDLKDKVEQDGLSLSSATNIVKRRYKHHQKDRHFHHRVDDDSWHYRWKGQHYKVLLDGAMYYPSEEELVNRKPKQIGLELSNGEIVARWNENDSVPDVPSGYYYLLLHDEDDGESEIFDSLFGK